MRRYLLPVALLAAVCFTLSPAAAAAEGASPDTTKGKVDLNHLEYQDNLPAQPARPVPGAAAAPQPRLGRFPSVQVNVGPGGVNIRGDAANEPSLAVDPTDPLRMAIVWRQFDSVQSNFRQAGFAYTTDEGRSWTFPGVLTPGVFRSDPVLSFDASGNFYWNSLKSDFTTDVFKSTDQGTTWGPAVNAYGGDKQWMEIDRTVGIGRGNAYSFWTADGDDFTRSTNRGDSFNPPSPIPSRPHWGTMAVTTDGTLFVVGTDASYSGYLVSKSLNAKNPLDPSTTFTTATLNLGGQLIYFTGPNPIGLLGQPWIAADVSERPTRGYLYVVGSVDPSGADPLDVHFVRSTNGGSTWSAPVRINDDPGTSAWQWFATMSVAPNGRIDVVWNDTRNTGVVNRSELFYSFSTNGGVTWSANQQLSPVWDSFVGWPNQQKIGDYYHMNSDLVGANLAWAATFNNEQDVYYLRIGDYDCNGNAVGDSLDIAQGTSTDSNGNGIPDECEGISSDVADRGLRPGTLTSTPNPFRVSTEIRFTMPEHGGHALLSIFNAGGRRVRTLLDEQASGGPYTLTWDGTDDAGRSVPAGVYLYRLDAAGVKRVYRTLVLR